MKPAYLILLSGIALLSVMLLAFGWEFWLEDIVMPLFSSVYEAENTGEHWEYIISITVFAFLSLIIPTYITISLATGRKQAEKALRKNEEMLASSQEIGNLGSWEWNATTDEGVWSDETYRIFGLTPGSPCPSFARLLEMVHPEDRDAVMKSVEEAVANRRPYEFEYRVIRPDETCRTCYSKGQLILDDAGDVTGMTGIIQDVTERKRLEHELAHAQKMQAVGKLTGGVAHEFNNLLQSVMSNLYMLRDYPGDQAETAEMLNDAIAASKRGGELTQQLLSFSRKQTLFPKVVNINDSLSGISRLLQGTLGESITLETRFVKDLVSVNIDPGSFENAILNLALNARAAMPTGGTVTLETANVNLAKAIPHEDGDLPVGKYVVVTVSDSGCGMSPEVLERAFEPFFTTRDVGQGTGLGLSMVYGFSRQSGGHTTIDSEPGKGTTVKIYLPIAEAEAIKEPVEPENVKAETKGSGTVLVVEDDPQVLKATVRFLKQIGYEALEAGDGPAALEVLQQHGDVDLVISDVIMPEGMSGIDLAEEIQHNHKGIRVLLMSGYPISEIDEDGTLEERFVLLRKPYTNDELAAAVKTAIEG